MNVTVVTSASSGGMFHYCLEMANALSREIDVTVIVDEEADCSLFDDQVSVRTLDFPGSLSQLGPDVVRLWTRLYRLLSRDSVDAVHATILNPLLVPPLLALRTKRTVFTLHDVSDHLGERKVRNRVARSLLVRGIDRVVVHGEYNAEQCRHRYPVGNKLVRITHGEYSFFRDCCDASLRYEPELLFFGRIRPYKGVDTLLQANQWIAEAVDEYRMTVAGSGPLDVGDIQKDHVTVINEYIPNDQVCRLFSRCRAVVLPYREASQSGIVPIAYSFGKPVVATSVGGLPEVIEDGRTGFLVEPEEPEALAEVCISLLEDETTAREMGRGAIEFKRKQMDWNDIARGLISDAYSRAS